ncbi:hypothetical protein FOL47_008836 [Perkinsus chesapeaki]|uniref:Ubiquitin-like domain-containing protein n=1 Tax=Perkinsus chesapeaki TaxID=330153 RepID=A0A7J6LBJ0_PERCH|nr:hypothetical protein FOL47_008836 [Perkinsus chesapeaki]
MPTHLFLADAERTRPAEVVEAEILDTIKDIKTKLSKATGIPPAEQMLFLDKCLIEDDRQTVKKLLPRVAEANKFNPQFVLRNCGDVEIPVMKLTGDAITIPVNASDTISTIKAKIEKAARIPADKQVLAVAGSIRQDYRAVAEYVSRQLTHHVMVKLVSIVEISCCGFVASGIELGVTLSTTIGEVKQRLRDELDIPIGQEKLFSNTREELDDRATMKDCGIKEEGFLVLTLQTVEGLEAEAIDLNGWTDSVFIAPSDTVDKVKEAVKKSTGFPVDRQKIMFRGEELSSGRIYKHAAEYSLPVYLQLDRALFVEVKNSSGKHHSIPIKPCSDIEELKRSLWSLGYSIRSQLFHNGLEISGNLRICDDTLREVRQGAPLNLKEYPKGKPLLVYIKEDKSEKKHRVLCHEHYLVEELRMRIQRDLKIPLDGLALEFRGDGSARMEILKIRIAVQNSNIEQTRAWTGSFQPSGRRDDNLGTHALLPLNELRNIKFGWIGEKDTLVRAHNCGLLLDFGCVLRM